MVLERDKHSLAQLQLPAMLYGTAWKEERTQELTVRALNSGFLGIDTANQRKHYFEEGVGLAVQEFLKISGKTRNDLFIQTKFTFADGQDQRKPYDELASFANQVKQSFASSLKHLQTNYIDSYILHGPSSPLGLANADWEVWEAMESLFHDKHIKYLGISNVTLRQLDILCKKSSVKPIFVQNRCFAIRQWDKEIRLFCADHGLIYQGFSLLTANQHYFLNPLMQTLVKKYQKTIPQIIFRFALQLGILPLTGTTSQEHMREDLDLGNFELNFAELQQIENISDRT